MSAPETARRDPLPPARAPLHAGRLVLGGLLVLLGVAWFVESVGLADVRWTMVLPTVLLVIGLVLLATARRGPAGGLVGAGILVTVLVIATSFLPLPFGGPLSAVGDVRQQPTTAGELEQGAALGLGSLEVDLRAAPMPAEPVTVEIGVAIGQVVVLLPADVTVEVRGRVGAGEVLIDGRSHSGVGVEAQERIDGEQAEPLLLLEVSAGLGQVEVRR